MSKVKLADVNPEDTSEAHLRDRRGSLYEFDTTDEESMRNAGGWKPHFVRKTLQKLTGPDEANNLYRYQDDRAPADRFHDHEDHFELRPDVPHMVGAVLHHVRVFMPRDLGVTLTIKQQEALTYYLEAMDQGVWVDLNTGERRAMRSDREARDLYEQAQSQGTIAENATGQSFNLAIAWDNTALPLSTLVTDFDVFLEQFQWRVDDWTNIARQLFLHGLINRANWAQHMAALQALHDAGDHQGLSEYDSSGGWTSAPVQGQSFILAMDRDGKVIQVR